jgi:hypothetical protein
VAGASSSRPGHPTRNISRSIRPEPFMSPGARRSGSGREVGFLKARIQSRPVKSSSGRFGLPSLMRNNNIFGCITPSPCRTANPTPPWRMSVVFCVGCSHSAGGAARRLRSGSVRSCQGVCGTPSGRRTLACRTRPDKTPGAEATDLDLDHLVFLYLFPLWNSRILGSPRHADTAEAGGPWVPGSRRRIPRRRKTPG